MLVCGVTELPGFTKMPDVHLHRAPPLVYLNTCSLFITIFHTSLIPHETSSRMTSLNPLPLLPLQLCSFLDASLLCKDNDSVGYIWKQGKSILALGSPQIYLLYFQSSLRQVSSFFRNLGGSVSQQ